MEDKIYTVLEKDVNYRVKPLKYIIDKETECWNCISHSKSIDGYVKCKRNNKTITAHRLSFEIHNNFIDKNLCVLHSCDNRQCINPKHLRLGTNYENVQDRVMRGRSSNKGQRKLTEENVLFIRNNINMGVKKLSEKFKVSDDTIYNVINNKTFKNLNTPSNSLRQD